MRTEEFTCTHPSQFVEEWSHETALTQKVLDALTDTSLQQQVSSGGRTLGRIAWHTVISIPEFLNTFGVAIEVVKDAADVPSSAKEISETFREVSANAAANVQQRWTDETLKQVQNAFGKNLPNASILSLLLKHMIYHRGQMTVLMRQAGLTVPGVYGPSKEEWSRIGQDPPTI
ncbi:MAG: DinB family protein [Alicyclobacillus sp.]|nr:DinB family protein [Alicyclobacillus sp.]